MGRRCDATVSGARCRWDEGHDVDHEPPAIVKYDGVRAQDWNALEELMLARDAVGYGQLLYRLCEDNVALWSHAVLGHDVTPHFVPILKEINKHPKLMVVVSRDHAKSTIFSIARISNRVAYSAMEDSKWFGRTHLVLRESAPTAENKVGKPLQSIFQQSKVKLMFGDLKAKSATWQDGVIRWRSQGADADPAFEARGIESAVLGGHHDDFTLDDVVSPTNSESETQRERLWLRWEGSISGMISPRTQVVNINTPQFANDMNARLRRQKIWKIIEMPALIESASWPNIKRRMPSMDDIEEEMYSEVDEVRTGVRLKPEVYEEVRPLWPCPLGPRNCVTWPQYAVEDHERAHGVHRSIEYLYMKFLEDPIGFQRNYMVMIGNTTGAFVTQAMIRCWAFPGDGRIGQASEWNESPVVALPPNNEIEIGMQGWDHALSRKKKSAETGLSHLWRTRTNDVYCLTDSGRWQPLEVLPMMESRWKTDPVLSPHGRFPAMVVTEGVNFQTLFGEFAEAFSKTILPIETVPHVKDKGVAFVESGLQAIIMRGKFYFHVDDVEGIRQFLLFSGSNSAYKVDRVDAVVRAYEKIRMARGRRHRSHRKKD